MAVDRKLAPLGVFPGVFAQETDALPPLRFEREYLGQWVAPDEVFPERYRHHYQSFAPTVEGIRQFLMERFGEAIDHIDIFEAPQAAEIQIDIWTYYPEMVSKIIHRVHLALDEVRPAGIHINLTAKIKMLGYWPGGDIDAQQGSTHRAPGQGSRASQDQQRQERWPAFRGDFERYR